jgi:hypothetical protein
MDATVQVTIVSDTRDQSSNPLHTGETDKLMSSSVRFVGLAPTKARILCLDSL